MGLFEKLFGKTEPERAVWTYFQGLRGYSPVYSSFQGGLYEMALTRACIHTFALHCSKLRPQVDGAARPDLQRVLNNKPNPFYNTKQYLYRIATIYRTENNAFIVPVTDETGWMIGFCPVLPSAAAVVEKNGIQYLRFQFLAGQRSAVEFDRVGVLRQYQYRDDFFGESSSVMAPTMELLNAQNQSIINGVKAAPGFLARLGKVLNEKDLVKEQKRLKDQAFTPDNAGGVLVFDQKYEEIKQVQNAASGVNAAQMSRIRESVFDYFGMSEDVLESRYDSKVWSAYYESQIEPFAVELGQVHTAMTFTDREISYGNQIMFTANRLQFLEPKEKIEIIASLFDRGMLCQDEGREIMQMQPLPDGSGKTYYIRAEYLNYNQNEENPGKVNDKTEASP